MIKHVVSDYRLWDMSVPEYSKLVDHIHEMDQWCDANAVGAFDWRDGAFWFEDEQDYSVFLLRWT